MKKNSQEGLHSWQKTESANLKRGRLEKLHESARAAKTSHQDQPPV